MEDKKKSTESSIGEKTKTVKKDEIGIKTEEKTRPKLSWVEGIVSGRKTDDERLIASSAVYRKVKREKYTRKISSFFFRILYLFDSLVMFFGISGRIYTAKDKLIIGRLPKCIYDVVSFFEKLFNAIVDRGISLIQKLKIGFMTYKACEITTYIIVGILLLVVIPSVIAILVKLICLKAFLKGDEKPKPKWTNCAAGAGITYKKLNKYLRSRMSNCSTWIVDIIFALCAGIMLRYVTGGSVTDGNVVSGYDTTVFGFKAFLITLGFIAAAFVAVQLISYIPKRYARKAFIRSFCLIYSDIDIFERFWGECDPVKQDELKKRDAEKAARIADEERIKLAKDEEENKKPTVIFNATKAPGANRFIVFIDGKRECIFDGGSVKKIKIKPGSHTIRTQVYNDANETSYSMEPMSRDFEEYEEYTVNYN